MEGSAQPRSSSEVPDDPLTREIIGAAIAVHRGLGPGLLETAYQTCLVHELRKRGLNVAREIAVPAVYDGVQLDCGYRIDLLVDDAVVVEVKAVERVLPVHEAQLLTYLKLANKPLGLLINFNVDLLKNGVVRRVLSKSREPPRA